MSDKSDLEQLKKEYKEIEKKFSLPSFDELNRDFSIEKISEVETEYLIREVRGLVSQKMSNYLRFVDTLLNPSNSPTFIFPVLKAITQEDKEKLDGIYKILTRREFDLIEVDIGFSEEKEAKFIKEAYVEWQKIKKDILEIIENVRKNWNHKSQTNCKGYFG